MKLYTYFRSSAAWRVRIALHWKGLSWENVFVHLRNGEHLGASFRARSPEARIPALEIDGGFLTQSLAILEYLEETHPDPPLLPGDGMGRARVRQLALLIACDVHPLQNLGALAFLEDPLGIAEEDRRRFARHWIERGLAAFEALVVEDARMQAPGPFCHGDAPTLADLCLVPQLYNARRYDCNLGSVPTLLRIEEACDRLEAFSRARPEAQPDAGGSGV